MNTVDKTEASFRRHLANCPTCSNGLNGEDYARFCHYARFCPAGKRLYTIAANARGAALVAAYVPMRIDRKEAHVSDTAPVAVKPTCRCVVCTAKLELHAAETDPTLQRGERQELIQDLRATIANNRCPRAVSGTATVKIVDGTIVVGRFSTFRKAMATLIELYLDAIEDRPLRVRLNRILAELRDVDYEGPEMRTAHHAWEIISDAIRHPINASEPTTAGEMDDVIHDYIIDAVYDRPLATDSRPAVRTLADNVRRSWAASVELINMRGEDAKGEQI